MADQRHGGDFFDGIEEEDNPMPDWWLWTFLGSIIFSGIYFIHYHVGTDNSLAKEYAEEKIRVEAALAQHGPSLPGLETKVAAALAADQMSGAGQTVFIEKCAACHGSQGEGLIGPNLTDKHAIHGGGVGAIAKTVMEGVPVKGMPAWGQVLSEDELVGVVAFVKSLEGKMVQGKAPEGEPFD